MGLGGVAIAILPSIICLKLTFSDGLGGKYSSHNCSCCMFCYSISPRALLISSTRCLTRRSRNS